MPATHYSKEELISLNIRPEKIPEHIAIIMDGNGRWATSRGLARINGHAEGLKTVKRIVNESVKLGIKYLTLYSFSIENWKRPKEEVDFLMKLCAEYLREELPELMDKEIQLRHIGRRGELPEFVNERLDEVIEKTSSNKGLVLVLALNYSGRVELTDAAKKLSEDILKGRLHPDMISEDTIRQYLYFPQLPDPDLLIRTANERRLSNFLIWQSAYTEFYTTPVLWPDFKEEDLHEAIRYYGTRKRKFGGLLNEDGEEIKGN